MMPNKHSLSSSTIVTVDSAGLRVTAESLVVSRRVNVSSPSTILSVVMVKLAHDRLVSALKVRLTEIAL